MIEETLAEAGEKMDKTVEAAKAEFAKVRTGRVNPGLFSSLTADYYGAPTPAVNAAVKTITGGKNSPKRRSTPKATPTPMAAGRSRPAFDVGFTCGSEGDSPVLSGSAVIVGTGSR